VKVKVKGILLWFATRLVWVVVALLIAVGAAGIVATIQQMPGTAARAELTWAADTEVEPALDTATADLEALAEQVDGLSSISRQALALLVQGDEVGLQDSISEGSAALIGTQALAARLDASLAAVPHRGDAWELYVAADLRHRYEELAGTPALAAGLEGDWAVFTGQALDAVRLARLLERHDTETAAAATSGAAGRYREALDALGAPDATLAEARELAGRLASRADTSTLVQWLDLNAGYDAALRRLYQTILDADGAVTAKVRAASKAEQAARARLPRDTQALVVIMNDVAQGGLNQAVISIEEARGALSAELDLQRSLQQGTSLPE
jgi:hypothetical protein